MNKKRFMAMLILCYLILAVYILRLFYLQIIKHQFFVNKAENQIKKIIKINSHRGNIFSRNNLPLALSRHSYSIYIMPPKVTDKIAFAKKTAPILKMAWQKIYKKINIDYPFIWLKRKAEYDTAKKIMDLNLPGTSYIKEEKRVYPAKELASDILGFVGTDGGLGGLEYKYNHLLTGSSGKLIIEGDPRGARIISGTKDIKGNPKGYRKGITKLEPSSFDGSHLYTTIDENIQYLTQKYLKQGVQAFTAKSGQAIVMDPKTGDIIAMADYPDFDPNIFFVFSDFERKNSCVVDVFEPGSVFKVITFAAVLEEGILTPETEMIVPEKIKLGGRIIGEAHGRKPEETDQRTAQEVIQKSLNVGTTLMAMELGKEKFYKYMKNFGFGQSLKIELPGESTGILRRPETWSKVDIGMMSFGQGIGITTLQLATAVSAIANEGILLKPRIVKYITDHEDVTIKAVPKTKIRRVISKQTAKTVLDVMTGVVEHGTGVTAKIPGYSIAGKTGTAQKAGSGGIGYLKDQYIASFVAVLPAYDPKFVIVVSIDTPKKSIWGSTVAAPVAKKIAHGLIDYYNIPPDVYAVEKI